jgi:carboxyl-terminal processing protease
MKDVLNKIYRMKNTLFIAVPILLVAALFTSYSPTLDNKDNEKKDQVLMQAIMQGLNSQHYEPQTINDDFSKKAFKLYLNNLDNSKKFLLASDVAKLRQYETKIDDEIQANSFNLLDLSVKLINQRVQESEKYYQEILEKPFDFSKEESVELDPKKLNYANNEAELKEQWRKFLKYQVLVRVHTALENQKDSAGTKKTIEEIEKEARERVKKSQEDWFRRLKQFNKEDWKSMYINAITNVFDPHTAYFAPKDKENFDIQMAGKLEGIGASLQERDGTIKVASIVPGSPSWKQGELKSGDIILKVAQGAEEPVEISNMRLDDAVRLIRGKKGTEVRLTVKKIDGTIQVIPIIRDVVIMEESYAKSAILIDEKTKQKIGYIKLPSFYADFKDRESRHCSEDVKQEVLKLKKENVNGIVLDLRNNGGGSLQDVVDMTGLFIEKGPIVQIKAKNGSPYIMNDNDPTVYYDGALVVMVNSFSASASEILAAAIQDYERGIVLGSTATFGKGTVQRFIALDDVVPSYLNDVKPLGDIKLTTQKFYRINGGTTQLKGVNSDIVVPDQYAYLEVGEKETEYPMKWDEIAKAEYKPWVKKMNKDKIVQRSQARIKNDEVFKMIEQNAKRLKKRQDETVQTLHLEKYQKEQQKLKEESKKYEIEDREVKNMVVAAIKGEEAAESDTLASARQKSFFKELKTDHAIYEALQIINDMQDNKLK